MKRKRWLGNEEKKTPESVVHRAGAEDHQPRSSELAIGNSVGPSTMDKLLKGIKNLKIAMVKMVERPTDPKYRDQRYI